MEKQKSWTWPRPSTSCPANGQEAHLLGTRDSAYPAATKMIKIDSISDPLCGMRCQVKNGHIGHNSGSINIIYNNSMIFVTAPAVEPDPSDAREAHLSSGDVREWPERSHDAGTSTACFGMFETVDMSM